MRLGSVDIGTNSVLLLVVELEGEGPPRTIAERCRITRLGEGVDATGQLAGGALARTLDALAEYAAQMEDLGVTGRAAVATSVLRDTGESGRSFLEQAAALLDCPVEVVSGAREAALVLAGVRGAFGSLPPDTLIFDVGGGSTEVILHPRPGAVQLVSLQLGAVRLTERYFHTDPPAPEEVLAVKSAVRTALQDLAAPFAGHASMIGVGGTVTTLATVELGLELYDTERVNGLRLSRAQVEEQIALFAHLPLDARHRVPGLEPARADIILAGAVAVAGILEHFANDALLVCDRGVRWGLLWEEVGTD
jgi:exopolyphosphatase/guanosine-5'-triphosphate,3'-diphosphate pyrophosphatase